MEPSPLRRARLARNWTLENLVEEMDRRSRNGHSGVTPSMVSGWERGRHTTSVGHRKTLCDIYRLPADVLFAHQDERLGRGVPRLLAGHLCLRQAIVATVAEAREWLVVMGSRARDTNYLGAIETALERHPALVCYRVLYGPPHHQILKDHLLRLLELRDPGDRSLGVKTLHLGIVEDPMAPERFFTACERQAVVPIPSLTSHEAFDSGVGLGRAEAVRLLDHGRQAYAASRRIETRKHIDGLPVVRGPGERP
ncbi:helix-turn-helix domain-containing protein [Sphaerisporangium rubeum]|uniref:Transcriptional regulator with XRE-family HTH domain n=1 Tax=Sphaerisporangium rubeum TaxID=321317 RepID=A0A7X0IEF5_9ACTN|nr:helix-turn-helix transcriptional regulator [Sphaerisporangium rubeum]MBB6473715.1 transcriptional regulator with XRE-family HTH domain [Sphaerisporangium rubeum]